MGKNEKYREIFLTSHRLFLSQGYDSATIHQISEAAGVSLGLTNHFFYSKQYLAGQVLHMVSSYTASRCKKLHPSQDSLLRTVLHTRVSTLYLLGGSYRRFYVESLRQDVMLHSPEEGPDRSLARLAKIYGFPADDDLFLLYGTYVPAGYEKSLILGKERSLFPTIAWDEIPDYITISSLEHFLDSRVLAQALSKARQAAGDILKTMPSVVPDSFVSQYLDRL